MINFIDLKKQYSRIKNNIDSGINNILECDFIYEKKLKIIDY